MFTHKHIVLLCIAGIALYFAGCRAGGDYPGREYMPDMTHSTAWEAYVPARPVVMAGGDTVRLFNNGASARKPVNGTIARGYMPYHFDDNEADYAKSGQTLFNPFNDKHNEVLEDGKVNYDIYCAVCHGGKGKGDGHIVKSGKYPGVPPSYFSDKMIEMPEGQMFHSVHYGKNLMGSYASQLTKEERWKIISYIKDMQAKHVAGQKKISKEDALKSLLGKGGAGAAALAAAAAIPTTDVDAASTDANAAQDSLALVRAAQKAKRDSLANARKTKRDSMAAARKAKMDSIALARKAKADEKKAKAAADKKKKTSELDKLASEPLKKGQNIVLRDVYFETASFKLKKESYTELNKLVSILKKNPKSKVEISGHTDNTGDAGKNMTLSKNRARAVYNYVVSKGIPKKQLVHKGYGQTKPIADNKTEEGKAKNRRTEFKVLE